MDIALLLFDLDETLAPDEATDRAIFAELGAEVAAGSGVPAGALAPAVDRAAAALWGAEPTAEYCQRIGIHAWEGLWGPFGPSTDPMLAHLHAFAPGYRVATWSAALAACGIADDSAGSGAALAERFLTERRGRQAAYPWSRAMLDELRHHYRLGIVTNGAPDLQRFKLARAGLAEYFDPVLVSGELGVGKPDAAIFAQALARDGAATAATAVMIGDSWVRDIQGALGAGLRAVWINPHDASPDTGSVGGNRVPIIADLRGLSDVLAAMA